MFKSYSHFAISSVTPLIAVNGGQSTHTFLLISLWLLVELQEGEVFCKNRDRESPRLEKPRSRSRGKFWPRSRFEDYRDF